MRSRVVTICLGPVLFGAASTIGCAKRALDSHDAGIGSLDAAGGGGANGSGGGAGGGGGGTGGAPGSAGASAVTGMGGFAGGPVEKKVTGAPCALAVECASSFCIDGVCCNRDCSAPCLTCAAPASVGTCVNRAAGDQPRIAAGCPVEVALTCGNDGTCDGAGACRLRVLGTVCGGGACQDNVIVGQMTCDGRGACRPGPMQICVPYTCDPATARCRDDCTTDADCVGTYCETTGRCHVHFGTNCSTGSDCASGFCANSVCCNTACADPCMACNLQGREGTCSPRPDGCPGVDAGLD